MKRSRLAGFTACSLSMALMILFIYQAVVEASRVEVLGIEQLSSLTYYSITIPIAIVALGMCSTGFWVGWTILTIKVAPPMPEIVEKKDYAKVKALILCLFVLAVSALFVYGIYLRSYWALAIPAAAITLVVLGMIFWVGVAIITSRSTLPGTKKS